MFREMRRKAQSLSVQECEDILQRGSYGVLAVLGEEDYPYAVPLNYVYKDGHIYFHCANAGHKLEAVQKTDKVSFCVVDKDKIIPEKYTTAYASVIVFGRIRLVEGEEAKMALECLGRRYAPDNTKEMLEKEISKYMDKTAILKLNIEHISGKQGAELMGKYK